MLYLRKGDVFAVVSAIIRWHFSAASKYCVFDGSIGAFLDRIDLLRVSSISVLLCSGGMVC
jgi:hypothetical protein